MYNSVYITYGTSALTVVMFQDMWLYYFKYGSNNQNTDSFAQINSRAPGASSWLMPAFLS